jgi:plastocyanin
MLTNKMIRAAILALAATSALVLTSMAPAHGTATVTISHQMRGCHAWALNSGPIRPSLSATVDAGTVVKFVNNDVMPHRLVQVSGSKVHVTTPSMRKMAATASVTLTKKGIYRFTTRPGEDYPWAGAMKTVGEDYVLHLTLRVK